MVYGSEPKLGLNARKGRKPDVSVYLPGARLPAKRRSLTRRPPSIVVEVLSPRPRDTRRDRVEKLPEYAKFGVPFYWLVDPELRLLEILDLGQDGRYAIALTASEGSHPVPGCDELTIDLDALWARLDALPEEEDDAEEPQAADPT